MVVADFTSSTVIVPSARSESLSANLVAAVSSSLGSGLKMPPGDLPVTIAHVANVTRSAASRGGTSAPSASVTASWVRTLAAAAAAVAVLTPGSLAAFGPVGPEGSVGGGGIDG